VVELQDQFLPLILPLSVHHNRAKKRCASQLIDLPLHDRQQHWEETKKNVEEIHEFLGNSLYFLIAIHAAAGLWQHYVVKDDALRRMLNKIKPST
jgi:cytochrome b561